MSLVVVFCDISVLCGVIVFAFLWLAMLWLGIVCHMCVALRYYDVALLSCALLRLELSCVDMMSFVSMRCVLP